MRIIIIGAGKVGYNLALNLSKEDHDVTIVDNDQEALQKAEENLDVLCIKGNGVSTNILIEAGIKETDLLIAVTDSDEVNMVCCLTGKKLGAFSTIARIRDPEYARELTMLKEEVGIDMVINPEHAAAEEIARSLTFPSAANVESFAKGRVKMIEVKITEDMPIAGVKLKDLSNKNLHPILIGAVVRNGEVIVPNGDFEIQVDDNIYILGNPSGIMNFFKGWSQSHTKIRNVMIVGAGRIAYYLTKMLHEMGIKVKIIEIDREKCDEFADLLPNTLVINGDGTDEEVLLSENIGEMDVFISLTGMDEENLISALIAKQNGAKWVVSKISRINYMGVVTKLGIDSVICPKITTTNQILKYVRGNSIETLYRIVEGQAEILEFIPKQGSKMLNIPLKKLKLPKDVIVATIVRKNQIVIPHGDDVICKDDRVIIIIKNRKIEDLDELVGGFIGGIQSELQNGIKKLGDIINM
ncbi:Trk system potassium transporter TrkA [Lutispora sp.]|uniref:Trk system potassium transporter TrkA n=1 Tax=Lutispora sp. TaxID=2828727 RepID=UPI000ECEF5B0|nr:Trk system potassium transporter TrkA [Lutispora sp.]MEA4963205.1 Trk system potassium transporter TrkA [Lutispora sp.]HCJ56451.1 Trk system potassium transporter TrkA [Clostridiaceae bacterium]